VVEIKTRRGAAMVYCVDVGSDQPAARIRGNPRGVDLAGRDARSLGRASPIKDKDGNVERLIAAARGAG
jgi:predicted rRNA methylase YqxC with S4 and FtsJ domains